MQKVENLIELYKFREALFEVIDLARKGNRYLQEREPWKKASAGSKGGAGKGAGGKGAADDTAKAGDKGLVAAADEPVISEENQQLIDNCLHICLQLTANLAIFINPFLPFTARKILHLLKVVDKILDWENAGKLKLLSVGYSLRAPELLFRKIEDEEVKLQVDKLQAARERHLAEEKKEVGEGPEGTSDKGAAAPGKGAKEQKGQGAKALPGAAMAGGHPGKEAGTENPGQTRYRL